MDMVNNSGPQGREKFQLRAEYLNAEAAARLRRISEWLFIFRRL